MVELFSSKLKNEDRKSSKGNQLKWEDQGIWYKADNLGYEGLSEYLVSNLLKYSSLEQDEFVLYEPEEILYCSMTYKGCKSRDFSGGWKVITLERLFSSTYGISLYKSIYAINDHLDRLKFLVEQVERVCGLKDFGKYMSRLFAIDALFLNEDRHTHNISVLTDGNNNFRICPVYDNGAALLSDTAMDYPLNTDIYDLISKAKAKTICDSFDEQLEIAEKLYGSSLKFRFTKRDVKYLLDNAPEYSSEVRDRVYDIILEQMRKYPACFSH